MAKSYFSGQTLDDVMRRVTMEIQSHGERIVPSQGPCTELVGVLLEITNPRARLSRTETRGKPFSCLGELCWYLAKSDKLEFIDYYIPYKKYADGNTVFGAYGPRLFNWRGLDQFANVTNLLREKPSSRQAVIQLFDACDITEEHNSYPCTCTLQFMVRGDRLHLVTHMRSNDVYTGLPHDVFSFTMLQEVMSRALSVELGTYKHAVGSIHLYDRHAEDAQKFLNEGWQPTDISMPAMPPGDPMPAIQSLVDAEAAIRAGTPLAELELGGLDPYWLDLIRLLQIFGFSHKDRINDPDGIIELRKKMSSATYDPFIDSRLIKSQERIEQQHLES